ncbi:hypothetical protein EXIGLDRAFT_836532 [Exidia glandulosa HHB12029]|uniref:Uncharacterized protein n=1 Tax=Exidia glandulosa HHB12029 TaxID=1314781 RepID=A0A165HR28_EXIGL|nr:hypothetical protein EXIGLDRAFT_836532 [Exidia glandulosa HHB12029]
MSDTSSESSSTHSSVTLASTVSNSPTLHDLTTAALATHALLDFWYLEHVFLGDFQLLLMGRTKPIVKGVDVEVRKAGLLLGLKAVRMLFAKDQAEWDLDLSSEKEKGFEVVHRPSGVIVRVFMRGNNDLFLSGDVYFFPSFPTVPFLSGTNFLVDKINSAASSGATVDAEDIIWLEDKHHLYEPDLVRKRVGKKVAKRACERYRALASCFMAMGFSF